MLADRAYDHDKYRKQVRAVGVTPVIARRGTEHGSGLGQYRWVVEQTFALLHWFRRLRIRWEIPRRHPRGIPSPGVRHHLPPPVDQPVTLCTSGSLTSGSKDDAEAPKATGRVGAVS
jgi:transposase